jgi:hypothetical protein
MTYQARREHVLTRNQLFHEIWSQPVSTVARRYGISGVALAKIAQEASRPPAVTRLLG